MTRRVGPYRDGRVHVLTSMCPTCVFRPGNLMHLQPGRLKDLVEQNTAADAALTCHATLAGNFYGAKPAVCRGFFDKYKTTPLQLAERLDVVEFDPTPGGDDA